MKKHILSAVLLTLCCIVFFCVIYTAAIWGIAQLAPNHGNGETIVYEGGNYGFANVGQSFTADQYFWSRPSAVNYNAAGSAGSNKGPSNPDYLAQVQARIDTFLVHNPAIVKEHIPAELVTASGSGLDPHLSPEAANVQVARIAHIRHINEQTLTDLVKVYTESPLFGPSYVNVLKLNIALDHLK
ncbi:MAG TPA: K(+)-transporting ATPase subunit C [Ohtaekwangia sp.]|uniref:K(+)-transporting ATPase subunit C n=1 Tax=Ohtaekwangia sp. TaxID=2066019 RepID=UPI002F948002